jgi:hypothetical protein
MPRPQHDRLIQAAVRCYPTSWRDRHGDEALELAGLLVRDGVSGVSVAWSYLTGAARAQLVVRPCRRLAATLSALLVGVTLIGVPLVLLDSLTPASADSSNKVIVSISNRNDAAGQLESVFRLHHFKIGVEEAPSSPSQVGSILAVRPGARGTGENAVLREIAGPCVGGAPGCIDAIALPRHYIGSAEVLVGRPAAPGETYFGSPKIFGPGEMLHCSGLLGKAVITALHTLRGLHVKIVWDVGGSRTGDATTPSGSLYVVGGNALSATSILIHVSSKTSANHDYAISHGQSC